MIVSILVFSLVNMFVAGWLYTGDDKLDNILRFIAKILMLPVVAGVSYEVLRLLAKTKSKFFLIFKFPSHIFLHNFSHKYTGYIITYNL